jgi:uncharacterized protein (TIGR03437 family)
MNRTVARAGALLALAAAAVAQQAPAILEGPVNAASYIAPGLPNGGIAQGSMFIIKGSNLGACGTTVANAFPLAATMGGTGIRVTVGGTNVDALMIYVVACRTGAPDQLAAILPSATPLGAATTVVTYGGRTSATASFRVVRSSFGVFTRNQAGSGPVIGQNFNSQTDQPVNGLLESANPGQTVTLWGSGLGAVTSDEGAGPVPGELGTALDVFVGGKTAAVTYRGRSGCCAGIDQIAFVVPSGVEGCYVPVAVRIAGVVSNIGTMSVAASGKTCAESSAFTAAELSRIQSATGAVTIGSVLLTHVRLNISVPIFGTITGNLDYGSGNFKRYGSAAAVMGSSVGTVAGLTGAPSLASCVARPFSYSGDDPLEAIQPAILDPVGEGRDAGAALSITGPPGSRPVPRQGAAGTYEYYSSEFLGGGIALPGLGGTKPDFLAPGSYTMDNGTGGAEVGAFRGSLTIPTTTVNWSNQAALSTVQRSQDLTVSWTGGAAGELVTIMGASADPGIKAGVQFICEERANAGTFTVPSWVLSTLPPSGVTQGIRVGFVAVGTSLAQPARFTATGTDVNFFNWVTLQLKNVTFQ